MSDRQTSRITAVLLALGTVGALGAIGGCAGNPRGPYTPTREAARNPVLADRLAREAADLLATDADKAERLLRDALGHDLYNGPAHNNLGVLYLQRGQLYEAAGEFQWARKLMPGHPDPRRNLGLVFEQAGRIDDAIDAYQTALEVYPDHLPSTQALARIQLRYDRVDEQTPELLRAIALRSTPEWRDWARRQLARIDAP